MARDLETDRAEASAQKDEVKQKEALSQHFATARRFLKRKAGDAAQGVPRKVKRSKAFAWCCMLDNALKVSIGFSLKDTQVEKEELSAPTKPYDWFGLSGVIDKGSDGVSGSNYLGRMLQLNIITDYDPSHGAWRSCINAMTESGMSTVSFLALMCFNIGYGEWKDGTRWEQIRQSVIDTTRIADPANDEIFQHVLPGIIEERALQEAPREDEFEREIYATLQDGGCWRVINSKLGYSRYAAPRISYIPIHVLWPRRCCFVLCALALCRRIGFVK